MSQKQTSHNQENKLEVTALEVKLGWKTVLRGIDVLCGPGVIGLCGANGSGKSTLMRTIAGIHQPTKGSISICGFDLQKAPVQARHQVGFYPEYAELYPYLTCGEFLQTIAAFRHVTYDKARQYLKPLGLIDCEDTRLGELSAGQRRKTMLAAALCSRPPILLFDEPTKGLDLQSRDLLAEQLLACKAENKIVILSTHLFEYAEAYCTSYLFLRDGQLIAQGELDSIREQEALPGADLATLYRHLHQKAQR